MYSTKLVFLSVCLFIFVSSGGAQSCRTRGEWCSDTELCCGGCCIQSVCVDITYEVCSAYENPCHDWYCPAGAVCRLYRGCKGCELERKCIFLNPNNDVNFQMDPQVPRIASSAELLMAERREYLLYCLLLISTYVF